MMVIGPNTPRAAPETVTEPSPLRVLMLEDDEEFAADMMAILPETVLLSRVAGSTEAAAELLRASFDLIWLDLDLPPYFARSGALEGLAFLRHLRMRYGPDLPVLVVSGRLSPELASRVSRLGVVDILAKPPDPERLRSLIANLSRIAGEDA